MKGKNEININQITMMVAIQHYFDTILFKEGQVPKVISVERINNNSFEFIVKVDEKMGKV